MLFHNFHNFWIELNTSVVSMGIQTTYIHLKLWVFWYISLGQKINPELGLPEIN